MRQGLVRPGQLLPFDITLPPFGVAWADSGKYSSTSVAFSSPLQEPRIPRRALEPSFAGRAMSPRPEAKRKSKTSQS